MISTRFGRGLAVAMEDDEVILPDGRMVEAQAQGKVNRGLKPERELARRVDNIRRQDSLDVRDELDAIKARLDALENP